MPKKVKYIEDDDMNGLGMINDDEQYDDVKDIMQSEKTLDTVLGDIKNKNQS